MANTSPHDKRISVVAIQNDLSSLDLIEKAFDGLPVNLLTATSCAEGRKLIEEISPRMVVLEDRARDGCGIDLIAEIVKPDPALEVIVLTDDYSTDAAVRAIKLGAADYLTKPISVADLRACVTPIVEQFKKRREIYELENRLMPNFEFEKMISRSPAMLDIFARIRRVGRHFRAVVVEGETGTGKELVARALHNSSVGAKKPFVACNCSALPEALFESELFGHLKGSFTGATTDKVGLVQAAHGGTLLLDEIGEMPLAQQARLLRVLQSREVRRIGSTRAEPVDVRIVAATNRRLAEMVERGEFRDDLYYRLANVEITLPPLRDRKEDLPMLFRQFVKDASDSFGKPIAGISRRAQTVLARYDWPGNVRELQSVIQSACMVAEKSFIDLEDLPDRLTAENSRTRKVAAFEAPLTETGWSTLREVQLRHTQRVLEAVAGNKARAAKILGVSRATLYRLLEDCALLDEEQENDAKSLRRLEVCVA